MKSAASKWAVALQRLAETSLPSSTTTILGLTSMVEMTPRSASDLTWTTTNQCSTPTMPTNSQVLDGRPRRRTHQKLLPQQANRDTPLSELRASQQRDLEATFQLDPDETEDITEVQAQQRVKRRKVMAQDEETMLHNHQIKQQQLDRSGITKAPSFLPRDPLLLQLMEMQRTGSFVSNIMGNGRLEGWGPRTPRHPLARSRPQSRRKRNANATAASPTSTQTVREAPHPSSKSLKTKTKVSTPRTSTP